MAEKGNYKTEVKRRTNRSSKVNRIVSLFEISRPSKEHRGLQRTNSLPATKRPSLSSSEENEACSRNKSYLRELFGGSGRVHKITEEIEKNSQQTDTISKSKPVKKKSYFNRKCFEEEEEALKKEEWLSDRDKIMENLNRLQERIEDVTQEIQNSDTELEITHGKASDENVFEDSQDYGEQEVSRDTNSDDSSSIYSRLSSDTVYNRLSSSDTIKEVCDGGPAELVTDDSVKLITYHRIISVESADESLKDAETNEFVSTEPVIKKVEAEVQIEQNEIEKDSHQDADTVNEPETNFESEPVEELNLEESDFAESMADDEVEHKQENNLTETIQPNIDTIDSIEWWKHKSFVQINKDDKATKTIENENSEHADKDPDPSPVIGGRFIKNNRSKRNRRTERRRTGILQKPFSVSELSKCFEGFKDAADNGETENYRQSVICEMDMELEKMKHDGFKEDFHLSFENLTLLNFDDDDSNCDVENHQVSGIDLSSTEGLIKLEAGESPLFQTIIFFPNTPIEENQYENLSTQDPDDIFGETLFSEDLENGLFYVETYNADGKELIMCSVQIDRQSVDLNRFDEMKAKSSSDVLANDERTLVLMEGVDADARSSNESKSGTDSKRTTIYSTTSGDSYDDEGIFIENGSNSYGYNAARRETYCDDQGIVRIERVAPYPENSSESLEYMNTNNNYYHSSHEGTSFIEEENYYDSVRLPHEIMVTVPEVKKDKLQYILDEIKSTELKYVADIRKVLAEYKVFLEERCPEKVEVVFGNMEQLYGKQLEFLDALVEPDTDIKDVLQAFIDFEDLWRLYPRYFKHTPRANSAVKELSFLIKEQQDRINDKLDLSAYLLTPLQRLGKYKLFLENILKQLEKEHKSTIAVQMALDIIKKYMRKGNDAVAIASILHSPLHLKDYGSFILREKFTLLKPKRMELMVFLFEGAIVFTTEHPKHMEQFVYYQSIKTNDLRIATFDDTTIHLTDYTKTKRRNSSKYTYIFDAKNHKLKATWKQNIEDILWNQMQKIKENTIKEYQKYPIISKKSSKPREQKSKSSGSSMFYVD